MPAANILGTPAMPNCAMVSAFTRFSLLYRRNLGDAGLATLP
jgi:hypothetical protein